MFGRNVIRRLRQAETRLQALAPPPLTRQQRWAYADALAVLGPARAAPVPPHRWITAEWLLSALRCGAPPTKVEHEREQYRTIPWKAPDPQGMQVIETWLASPEAQTRPIDPFYTLRGEIERGLCGSESFVYDLVTTSVALWGPLEAWETLPRPDAQRDSWGWQAACKACWAPQPLEDLWQHVRNTLVALAIARHVDAFRASPTACTRDTDVAIAETLHKEHRAWLTWMTTTSPAIVPAPAPWRPMPAEKWAVEIQQAQAGGLIMKGEMTDAADPAGC